VARSPRGRFAPYVIGTGTLGLSFALLGFTLYAAIIGEAFAPYLVTSFAAAAIGAPLYALGRTAVDPTRREALLAVLLLWLVLPGLGVIPYLMTGVMGPLDAFFESMSGFTATGATVLVDFDAVPASLFMWRAFTQWVGGIGIVVVFVAVFPQLAIAGREIFHAELPGPTEDRLAPRLRTTAMAVLGVYLGLTLTCAVAYYLVGMPLYDAVAHAFTTVAAAGFSPQERSFEAYGLAVDWVAITFMTLAAVNFALLFRAFLGRPRDLLRDPELRTYLAIVVVAAALLTFHLSAIYDGGEALRHGLFQTVSILTTTGYASADFELWPDRARVTLLVLMFIGGSAGSAAGGVKVMRWLIIMQHTAREVRRALHPRAVLPLRVGARVIPDDVLRAVAAFITLYVLLVGASATALVFLGHDFVTSFTAAAATVGNVGPGLGLVGPMGSYADLHPIGRGLLIFNMYAGRLEIVTVFVILAAGWWKLPRRLDRPEAFVPPALVRRRRRERKG
jgi:trk system potassium uptake protein